VKYFITFGRAADRFYLVDFNCKCNVCGSDFILRKDSKSGDFRVVRCSKCRFNCSKDRLISVFGEDLDSINKLKEMELEKRRRANSVESYIKKHGEKEGLEKFERWKNTCRTGKQTLIERYGEQEGLIRFEQFREKSNLNIETFKRVHGENWENKWREFRYKKEFLNPRNINYWLEKTDGDLELAKKLLYENQGKFNKKEFFIEKFGEKEGLEKYEELNARKTKNWKNKGRYSEISMKLFNEIQARLDRKFVFGESGEKRIEGFWVDFYDEKTNSCIEFNGDFWHANPDIYEEKDVLNIIKKTAKQLWEKDDLKSKKILESGHRLLIVWEKNLREDFEKELEKCIVFLNEGEKLNG